MRVKASLRSFNRYKKLTYLGRSDDALLSPVDAGRQGRHRALGQLGEVPSLEVAPLPAKHLAVELGRRHIRVLIVAEEVANLTLW